MAALRGMAERLEHTNLLKEISVPTLLIFGREDKVTNLDGAKILNDNIPNSKLEIIDKIGHYANLENSEEFNKILINFVKDYQNTK
jgi:pimeloyl-ACP methyl ester carboxylesterase